ncbi:MAG: nucleotide exchange factor GrpE [Symploca sp. SIO2E6]|nr:nucleotide exchange factor GrpE [Symploca sp. SIO2E6]
MIDEEKQQDFTSQQADEPVAISSEDIGGESAREEMDLSAETELDPESNPDEQTSEASNLSEVTGEGKTEVVAASGAEGVSADTVSEMAPETAAVDTPEKPDDGVIETLTQEKEALKAQLEELTQQYDSLKSQSMRIAADFENFRKRTGKEKEELEQQIKQVTLMELLPVVDNFERARSQLKPQNDGEMSIHKSYQGIYKQLVDCLKRIGVSPMRPEGKEFDPNLHEAVMRESTDEYPEGTVIEQLQRGYFLSERVLRHAMVKVAAAVEPVVTSEENNSETTEN